MASAANHIWSIDFVHDKLSNGRSYKMLTVLDEYTREALSVIVATSMGSAEVLEALYPLLLGIAGMSLLFLAPNSVFATVAVVWYRRRHRTQAQGTL